MYSNYQYRGIRVDSLFLLPKFADTNSVTNNMKNIHGNLIRVDKKFFYRDTALSKWTELAGGGTSTDTTSLSNRIDGKVPYTGAINDLDMGEFDVSAHEMRITGQSGQGKLDMRKQSSNSTTSANSSALYADANGNFSWQNDNIRYFKLNNNHFTADHFYRLPDTTGTIALLQNVDTRLKISDTAAMLSSYLLEQDTVSLSNRIDLKLNISDTSTMLSPYLKAVDTASLSDRINAIPIIDTTSLSNRIDAIDLQSVTDKGAVTNDTIGVYGVSFYDQVNNESLLLNVADYGLQFKKPNNSSIFLASPETFGYWNPSGFPTNLNFRGTASRDIDFPDSSGTVALLSNLNGITLQSVTDNGDTTTNDIYANSYYLYEQVDGGYGRVYLADNVMEFSSANGNLFAIQEGLFSVYGLGGTGAFSVANITNNRNYNLPDTSGTFILNTDTSGMLSTYIRSSIFPIATFGGGSGAAGDTTIFTTDAIYGSFYNAGTDSIVVTSIDTVQRSGSVTTTVYYNTSIDTSGATTVTAGSTIPPARHVWVQTTAITTKPTYYSVTLNGYRKRP
jgi:hypothetical protein